MGIEAGDRLIHLHRQLTSWGEDQSLHRWGAGINPLQDRQGEGGSFARPRLGLTDHIPTRQEMGQSLGLDGSGRCKAKLFKMVNRRF